MPPPRIIEWEGPAPQSIGAGGGSDKQSTPIIPLFYIRPTSLAFSKVLSVAWITF